MMHLVFDESVAKVKTDQVKLKQILINLISNAFKYSQSGTVECGYKPQGNKLLFYVSDTGIGIPEDKFDFIFRRFAQLNILYSENSGTGLGLSIVKGLVGLLGGEVWLESECNKGTTFYFTIDYLKSENINDSFQNVVNDQTGFTSTKTILIVEDDMYNAKYLQEILKNTVSDLITVNTGKEAINIIKNKKIDIILMDVRLPDITGYEATRIILQYDPNIKIIAQTAYAANDERQKALDAGCVDYISKPTKLDQLFAILKNYL
ncbi:MAG: response regulator [Bacteroidales bacterium]|nr:response regulator [Bacteroidales bacterium]